MRHVSPTTRGTRLLLAMVLATIGALQLGAQPAAALTPTLALSDTRVGASNVQYGWTYTALSTGTRAAMRMTVTPGTSGTDRYLWVNGRQNQFMATSAAVAPVSGAYDVRARVKLDSWANGSTSQRVINGPNFVLDVKSDGKLGASYTKADTTVVSTASTVATGFAAGAMRWVRVTFAPDNGAGGSTTRFWTSTDGTTWTQLGTDITGGSVVTMSTTAATMYLGGSGGAFGLLSGRIYFASVQTAVQGATSASSCRQSAVAICFDPSNAYPIRDPSNPANRFKSSSSTGETWRLAQDGTLDALLRSDIAAEVPVLGVSGVPAGGTAEIREAIRSVVYTFPAPTTINSGTAISISVGGLNNAPIPATMASAISVRDDTYSAEMDSDTAVSVDVRYPSSTLKNPNLTLSSGATGGTGTSFTFRATNAASATAIGCIDVRFSTTSDGYGATPTGMDLTAVSGFDSASTWTTTPAQWLARGASAQQYAAVQTDVPAAPGTSSPSIRIDGIGNPTANGTYFAILQTYSKSSCNTPVDTMVTAFAVVNGVVVTATIDPTVTFTVTSEPTSCNGASVSAGTTATASTVDFGHLNISQTAVAAQRLQVTTNAASGFAVVVRSAQALSSSGDTVPNIAATNATPGAFGTGRGFGYTVGDATLDGNPTRFTTGGPLWAGLESTDRTVLYAATGYVDETNCIAYRVQTDGTTKSGAYTGTIVYTAVPNY